MDRIDIHLDEIFNKARTQPPKTSFAEVSLRFVATISTVGGGVLIGSWILKFLSSTKGILITASLIVVTSSLYIINTPRLRETKKLIPVINTMDTISKKVQTSESTLDTTQLNTIKEYSKITGTNNKSALTKIKANKNTTDSIYQHNITETLDKEPGSSEEGDSIDVLTEKTDPLLPGKSTLLKPEIKIMNSTNVQFIVNELTSTNELARISYLAGKAGIEYVYVIDLKRKTIREFNVKMTIYGTNIVSRINISVPKKGKFEVIFGWSVNEKGKAVELSESVTIAQAKSEHHIN